MTKEKKGFKRTEVGLIPEDWEIKTIGDIAEVKGGKRLPSGFSLTEQVTPYPYIRVADMESGGVDLSEIPFVPDEAFPKIKNYRIYKDDLFISVAGTLGIIGEVPEELDGANLTENADRITRIKCNKKYLMYVMMSPMVQNEIDSGKTLGAQPKLALGRIKTFQIPLPPTLEEQQAIASALSDMDELIRSLDGLIQKKQAIKKGTMQQLLTPSKSGQASKKRLHGFDGEWGEVNMGKDASLKARIGWQGLRTDEYLDNGEYYLVTGIDFKNGRIDWEGCHYVDYDRYKQDTNIQLKEGDVLVTKGGTIGKVAIVEELNKPATLNSGVFVIRPTTSKFVNEFLFYTLSSIHFSKFLDSLTAGSTINHLYQKDFVTYTFEVPPTIEEQKAIAQILSDMDRELQALRQKREKYVQVKQGMMQQLLTGRIRIFRMEGSSKRNPMILKSYKS